MADEINDEVNSENIIHGIVAMLSKISLPVKIGLGFGLVGILLVIIGIFRGSVPANPASIAMALLIGGGFWFLVSWAVATAAVDVESDVEESDFVDSDEQSIVDA